MGYDYFEVRDFLEEKGITEANIGIVIDYLKNPDYKNPLGGPSAKKDVIS